LENWTAEQVVFIDESGINSKLSNPTHGYAPKGQAIPFPVKPGRAENVSLLPAITIDGYISCDVYRGGVHQDQFYEFIAESVLPKCNRFPGPKSIIVMDNARIHHGDVFIRYKI